MDYWHDIVRSYDNWKEKDARRKDDGSYSEASVVILLMYLAFGEDHASNIAGNFPPKPENKDFFKKKRRSALKYQGKISSLLKKMSEDGLLSSYGDEKDGRIIHYEIDPNILKSPAKNEPYYKNGGTVFEIPLAVLEEFFTWLKEFNKEDARRRAFIKALSEDTIFDYITFLMFIKARAIDWEKLPDVEEGFTSTSRLSELIEEYIVELEKMPDVKPRLSTDIIRALKGLDSYPLRLPKDRRNIKL